MWKITLACDLVYFHNHLGSFRKFGSFQLKLGFVLIKRKLIIYTVYSVLLQKIL